MCEPKRYSIFALLPLLATTLAACTLGGSSSDDDGEPNVGTYMDAGADVGVRSDAGANDASSWNLDASVGQKWGDVRLASSTAKPLAFVDIEGLPEKVNTRDLYARIRPGRDVDGGGEAFPGGLYQQEDGNLVLIAPFLGADTSGTFEVVVTDGTRRSRPLTLTLESIDVREGAFAESVEALDRTVRSFIEDSDYSLSEIETALDGDEPISRAMLPHALAYQLVSDPDNPKALTNLEIDAETRRLLDAFATRADLKKGAEAGMEAFGTKTMPLEQEDKNKENLGFEPVEITSAAQLSRRLKEYNALQEEIESLQRFKTIFGYYMVVAAFPLATTGGTAVAVLGNFLTIAGINVSVYKYMNGTKLGQLPCCFEAVTMELENGKTALEDAKPPQVQLESARTRAHSQGMNFTKKTRDLIKGLLKEAVAQGAGKTPDIPGEGIPEKAADRILDKIGHMLDKVDADDFASYLSSLAAKQGWDAAIETKGGSRIVYEWSVALHGPRIDDRPGRADGTKWLQSEVSELPSGGRMLKIDSPIAWSLKDNAYQVERSIVSVEPAKEAFPLADYMTSDGQEFAARPGASRKVVLEKIDVAIEPGRRSVSKGETVSFDVDVEQAADETIADVEATAGTVVQQPQKASGDATYTFKWKAPSDESAFPVGLTTKSLSDQGFRSRFNGPGTPIRSASATVTNGSDDSNNGCAGQSPESITIIGGCDIRNWDAPPRLGPPYCYRLTKYYWLDEKLQFGGPHGEDSDKYKAALQRAKQDCKNQSSGNDDISSVFDEQFGNPSEVLSGCEEASWRPDRPNTSKLKCQCKDEAGMDKLYSRTCALVSDGCSSASCR